MKIIENSSYPTVKAYHISSQDIYKGAIQMQQAMALQRRHDMVPTVTI